MPETEQVTVFGDTIDEQVRVETTGRVIRPFKRMVGEIASEFKLHFDSDGAHVTVNDAANVGMVDIHLDADAFETYELTGDSYTLGLSDRAFGSVLQHARYGTQTDDAITLTANDTHLETSVTRPVGDTTATFTERAGVIDPKSVREEPEFPDLEFGTVVDLKPRTLIKVLEHMDLSEHVKLGAEDGALVLNQEFDIEGRNIELDVDVDGDGGYSYYSGDYVKQLSNALQMGYVDDLALKWGEEFPLVAEFEREDVYHGSIMLAPRVTS